MPKVPRDVSHDALVHMFRRRGWAIDEGARHTIVSLAGNQVAIPRHHRLKTGTVAAILKQAGISIEDAARDP